MKTPLFPLAIFLTVMIHCASTPQKARPADGYAGIYAAETNWETAKQWDTFDIRKLKVGEADTFFIFYTHRFIKQMDGGQWTVPKTLHDSFIAVYHTNLYSKGLMVGNPLSMGMDTVDGKPVRFAPFRPLQIDTVRKKAWFGGIVYNKIR